MEENYIHIFCAYLSQCLLNKSAQQKDVIYLVREFYPVCDDIHSREDLSAFIGKHTTPYGFLEELKQKLNDKKYIFNLKI